MSPEPPTAKAPSGTPPDPDGKVYRRAFWLMAAGLMAGIVVLAVLVTTSGPRVRHVVVKNTGDGEVSVLDQGLTFVFDRPVSGGDVGKAVGVEPAVDHEVSHRQGQISVSFGENLRSNTNYVLTVAPELEDASGEPMASEYRYEFTTAEPTYTYLERNYSDGAKDRIIERAPLSGKSQVLFEAAAIESFARDEEHMAVSLPRGPDEADELRVVGSGGGGGEPVEVPGNVKIDELRFSPAGGQFVFVTRVNIGDGADEAYKKGYQGKLYRYDLEGDSLGPVDSLSDGGNVETVTYSRDGQALLYGMLDGTYYVTGAVSAGQPVPLGNHDGDGGFNTANDKIIFRQDTSAEVYDAKTKKTRELAFGDIGGSRSTPEFLNNSDSLVFTENVMNEKTGGTISRVGIASPSNEGSKTQVTAKPSTYFHTPPKVSYDDRYILAGTAPASGGFDPYPANPLPEDARLSLYDRMKDEVIEEVRGADPVWSR